jgi:hypothetical protein
MPKFRKRPEVIEAEQFLPAAAPLPFSDRGACCRDGDKWYVTTIHGQQTFIVPGDWIIPEPDGKHFYPCKPDIFEATYEPVAE